MKILITGATGFIGAACVRMALARGHRVAGLVRTPQPAGPVEWISGDLAQPDEDALAAFAADSCIHTAWIAKPGEYLDSPRNHDFLAWSLAFLDKLAPSHCVALGSCIEYGAQSLPLQELRSPLAPANLYGQCKDELRRALQLLDTGFCWARIFYPYGPGEHPRRLPTCVLQQIARNEEIALKTPESIKDYLFIDDLAAALLTLAEQRFQGPVNVGCGEGVSVRTLAETAGAALGKKARIVTPIVVDDPYPCVVADVSRLTALGWKPATPLSTGLSRLATSLHL